MTRLLIPLLESEASKTSQGKPNWRKPKTKADKKLAKVMALNQLADEVSKDRNRVVHQGEFRGEKNQKRLSTTRGSLLKGLCRCTAAASCSRMKKRTSEMRLTFSSSPSPTIALQFRRLL